MPRSMLAGLILALLAGPAAAQTVDEVIARSLEARGGLERLKAIRSVRMTGRVSAGDRQMTTVVEAKRPALIRVETIADGVRMVQAFDGKTAWGIPPMGTGRPEVLPAEAARGLSDEFDIDGPLVDYRAKGHTVELVGKAKVGGREAWEIRVTRKSGGVERHFLDVASSLPVRVETKRTVRGAGSRARARSATTARPAGSCGPSRSAAAPAAAPRSRASSWRRSRSTRSSTTPASGCPRRAHAAPRD